MIYTQERLINILSTVNATAVDNDGGRPGPHLAAVCRQAADVISLQKQELTRLRGILGTQLRDDAYINRPARSEEFGSDEVGC